MIELYNNKLNNDKEIGDIWPLNCVGSLLYCGLLEVATIVTITNGSAINN